MLKSDPNVCKHPIKATQLHIPSAIMKRGDLGSAYVLLVPHTTLGAGYNTIFGFAAVEAIAAKLIQNLSYWASCHS